MGEAWTLQLGISWKNKQKISLFFFSPTASWVPFAPSPIPVAFFSVIYQKPLTQAFPGFLVLLSGHWIQLKLLYVHQDMNAQQKVTQNLTQHENSLQHGKHGSHHNAVLRCSQQVSVAGWSDAHCGFVCGQKHYLQFCGYILRYDLEFRWDVWGLNYLIWCRLVDRGYAVGFWTDEAGSCRSVWLQVQNPAHYRLHTHTRTCHNQSLP